MKKETKSGYVVLLKNSKHVLAWEETRAQARKTAQAIHDGPTPLWKPDLAVRRAVLTIFSH